MKIVCISDTHLQHSKVDMPDGDMLIHAGDATVMGTAPEVHEFSLWWKSLKYKYKIFVPGNHDFLWDLRPTTANSLVQALHEETIEVEGLKIYGAAWTPEFGSWAFMLNRVAIANKWLNIPQDADILITHGPPYGILDLARECSVGDKALYEKVRKIKPKLHVFGHIHHNHGKFESYGTTFVNAAVTKYNYEVYKDPIVIEL